MSRKLVYTLALHGPNLRLDFNDHSGSKRDFFQPGDVLRVEPAPSVRTLLSQACEFPIVEVTQGIWRFGGGADGMLLAGMQCSHCRSIVSAHKAQLVDLLLTYSLRRHREDFLYIGDFPTGGQWALSVACATTPIRAVVSPVGPPSFETLWPTLSAAYLSPNGAQAYAQTAFGLLTDAVDGFAFPAHLPLFDNPADLQDRRIQLTVRVNSRSLWPMAIPLDHFQAYHGYGRFSHYSGIEWILTQKTFLQNALEREALRLALSDPDQTLPHAVFIINEYAKFNARNSEESRLARNGVILARKVLKLLCTTDSARREPGLGVFLSNPDSTQLVNVLRDRSTRYVFANFHTSNGEWMISDVPSLLSPTSFRLRDVGNLAYIRYMQLFHCESVPTVDGPPDRHSICQELLTARVGRVSGSTFDDDFLAYLCWLLAFVYRNPRWRDMLKRNAAECSIDPDKLVEQIPLYLDACGLRM